MSCSYADGLSPYENKGKLGLNEIFDSKESVESKVAKLAEWIKNAKHVVFHTGAGVSTSAGIPDFRGPNGVWTLEKKGEKPTINISFDQAVPTATHMAIVELVKAGKIQYVVSQNIDGLHLKSGLGREYLAELHGNMFIEQCSNCKREFVMKSATTSVGQRNLNRPCPSLKVNGRRCRGKTHDTILDWEHNLPDKDLKMSDYHAWVADLSICLGTTLQIVPSGNLPLFAKKREIGKLVICNLQPTKHDKKADLIIHSYVDDIMIQLLKCFDLKLPDYDPNNDPTKSCDILEWTIKDEEIKTIKTAYEAIFSKSKRKLQNDEIQNLLKKEKVDKEKDNKNVEIKKEIEDVKNNESDTNNWKHNTVNVIGIKEEVLNVKIENSS